MAGELLPHLGLPPIAAIPDSLAAEPFRAIQLEPPPRLDLACAGNQHWQTQAQANDGISAAGVAVASSARVPSQDAASGVGRGPRSVPNLESQFEWHEEKNLANIRKRGIRFEDAARIFHADVVVIAARTGKEVH